MSASLRARILRGIAVPAIVVIVSYCVTVHLWVRSRELDHLDRSLEIRAAAMAALVDLDGGVWDVEFDREDVPVVELFGSLTAYEVRVADNGGLLARRRPGETGVDARTDPTTAAPDSTFGAAATLPPVDLATLPKDRPLELAGGIRTLTLPDGRVLRAWDGVYLVRAHEGEPGEGGRMAVGAPPGPVAPIVRISVAEDPAPVLADLRALLAFQVLAGTALGALALVAGWVLSGRIVAPIDHIARRAAEVRAPSKDPPLPLAGTGDEIDRLAEALNQSYLRLHAAYALQGRFTADASHELRTPLAVIRTNVELALARPRSAAEYEEVLAAVMSGAVRMEDVLEGLLLLARADAGGQDGARERLDLATLAHEVVDELQPADGPLLRVEEAGATRVIGDDVQLSLVLRNLLSNAIRHTPAHGEVVVRVATEGDRAIVEVRDTGEGIPPDALPRVFERFFRADASRARGGGGAGLGLSIVQAVVLQHGGTVGAESTLGSGTTVRVRLPRAAEEAA